LIIPKESPPYEVLRGKSKHENDKSRLAQSKHIFKKYDKVQGEANLYKLFTELAVKKLVKKTGFFAFIMPTGLISDKSSLHLRKYVLDNFSRMEINEFPEKEKIFKDVTQAVSIFIFNNQEKGIFVKTNLLNLQALLKSNFVKIQIDTEEVSFKLPKINNNQDMIYSRNQIN